MLGGSGFFLGKLVIPPFIIRQFSDPSVDRDEMENKQKEEKLRDICLPEQHGQVDKILNGGEQWNNFNSR